MTGLHEFLASQREKHCALCGVSLFLNMIQFGLMLALHGGG
jgi:hypothetical protein